MRHRNPYLNCRGLTRDEVRAALNYDPSTGILSWRRKRGGPGVGEPIITTSFILHGYQRNTFGIIYMYVGEPLPHRMVEDTTAPVSDPDLPRPLVAVPVRVSFRDGDGRNWRWENIKPLLEGETAPDVTEYTAAPGRRMTHAQREYLKDRYIVGAPV